MSINNNLNKMALRFFLKLTDFVSITLILMMIWTNSQHHILMTLLVIVVSCIDQVGNYLEEV